MFVFSLSGTGQQMIEPPGLSVYVVGGAGGLCLTLASLCVFYSSKSISVKLPPSPVSFVDRSGSREERGEGRRQRAGGGEKNRSERRGGEEEG